MPREKVLTITVKFDGEEFCAKASSHREIEGWGSTIGESLRELGEKLDMETDFNTPGARAA